MRNLGRRRQRGIDGGSKGVDQLRPFRAEEPQEAAAMLAEMPLCRTGLLRFTRIADFCMVNRDVFAALDLHAIGIAADVGGITAAALRLAADRAIATLVGVGGIAVEFETYGATLAGAFQLHGSSSRKLAISGIGTFGVTR